MTKETTRIRPPVDKEAIISLWRALSGEDAQKALSDLCAAAKDGRVKELLNSLPDRPSLRTLLSDERPKVRKNAARLIGELYLAGDFGPLKTALFSEETRYVLPSIVLAMGNAGPEALDALKEFSADLPKVTGPEDEKHDADLKAALSAALSRCGGKTRREFLGLFAPADVLLTVQPGCEKLLFAEAAEKGIGLKQTALGAAARTIDYKSLFCLRTFHEALFPMWEMPAAPESGKTELFEWAKAASPAAARFAKLLSSCLSGGAPYPYRIELRAAEGDRTATLRALERAIGETGELVNSPSAYDAEFRAIQHGGKMLLFAKLFVPADPRFLYRKGAVSASINPVAAASLMRFALPYLKDGARAIDPCCGSGTLLIERAKLGLPVSNLLGVDIDKKALDIARENAEAAKVNAGFVRADSGRFEPKAPFDELFANLPFGTRVGTAEKNADFYKRLVSRLDALLTKSGVAVFYTTQFSALNRLLFESGWEIADRMRFEAGGLSPWGIIARRKGAKGS